MSRLKQRRTTDDIPIMPHRWTRVEIARAIREWIEEYGFAPRRKDWRPGDHEPGSPEALRFQSFTATGEPRWPNTGTVVGGLDWDDGTSQFPTMDHAVYYALTKEDYGEPWQDRKDRSRLKGRVDELVNAFVRERAVESARPAIKEEAVESARPAIEEEAVKSAKPAIEQEAVVAAKPEIEQEAITAAKPLIERIAKEELERSIDDQHWFAYEESQEGGYRDWLEEQEE